MAQAREAGASSQIERLDVATGNAAAGKPREQTPIDHAHRTNQWTQHSPEVLSAGISMAKFFRER